MPTLHRLRRFTALTRFVLVWFVLSMGVAIASPIVKPQDILLVCSASGAMKVVVKNTSSSDTNDSANDDASSVLSSTMDCPLCMTISAPPPITQPAIEPVSPLAYALQSIPSAHIAARTAAPLPARGPPQHA